MRVFWNGDGSKLNRFVAVAGSGYVTLREISYQDSLIGSPVIDDLKEHTLMPETVSGPPIIKRPSGSNRASLHE